MKLLLVIYFNPTGSHYYFSRYSVEEILTRNTVCHKTWHVNHIYGTSRYRLATFQGPHSHKWLVAAVLDGAALEYKTIKHHVYQQHRELAEWVR